MSATQLTPLLPIEFPQPEVVGPETSDHGAEGNIELRAFVVGERQADLLQVVGALGSAGCLSRPTAPAGKSREIKTAMMAMTTRSSISVNPRRFAARARVSP